MPVDLSDEDVWKELNDTEATTQAGFTPDSGQLSSTWLWTPEEDVTADDLHDLIIQLQGDTSTEAWDGRIDRTLPTQYPIFGSNESGSAHGGRLWCAGVNTIQGVGKPEMETVDADIDMPNYSLYPDQYRFKLHFKTNQYSLLENDEIEIVDDEIWYDNQDHAIRYTYAKEWLRYTWWDIDPRADYATAQKGQRVFHLDPDISNLNKTPFTGEIKKLLPDSIIKFMWYKVPFRYITSDNSYIKDYIGKVNQYDWYRWGKGELLYLNYKPTAYIPPFPDTELEDGTVQEQKLCNIEFTFLQTTRIGVNAPTTTNRNWVAAGHNFMPNFLTNRFHYVDNLDTPRVPIWFSFPFPLIFTDPDLDQPDDQPRF